MWMLGAAPVMAACGGCAKSPGGTGSGLRLVVTLRFNGRINPNYQYFFLIRNANDPLGQNGPIPVIQPPYLNGFATGQNTATAAFTDFVEFSRVQRQLTASGYALYHLPGGISGDPNANVFAPRGEPDSATPPGDGNILRFELDVARLAPDLQEPDPNNGARPRFLQVNVVATTTTPNNPQTPDPAKFVDAFGDQRPGSGSFNAFVTLDVSQVGRTYQSSLSSGDPFFEPEKDSFPADQDPGIDLVAWSVQITGR
jgi:hypothetical protein